MLTHDPSAFDAAFEILEKSFPDDERRPRGEQRALLDEPRFRLYFDGSGFMTVWEFEDFAFLEHFAVSPEARGRGTGAAMLRELCDMYGSVLLECEPETDGVTARRAAFYRRSGFFTNDFFYEQPPISAGKKPVRLNLMTFPRPFSPGELDKARDILYKYVYKVRMIK